MCVLNNFQTERTVKYKCTTLGVTKYNNYGKKMLFIQYLAFNIIVLYLKKYELLKLKVLILLSIQHNIICTSINIQLLYLRITSTTTYKYKAFKNI